MLAILIPADQFAHIFAAGAVTALIDLLIHEGLERIRQGDVHRAHELRLDSLAKFGEKGSACERLEQKSRWHGG